MPVGTQRPVRPAALDVVVSAAAVSAGAHAALVPEHAREAPQLGIAFVLAAVLLLVAAIVATRTDSRRAMAATALLFAGLITAYVEAFGCVAALKLIQSVGGEGSFTSQEVAL